MITQTRARRSVTGSRYKTSRGKRLFEEGRAPALTKLGDVNRKWVRTKAGGNKQRLLQANVANVFDPKSKKYSQAKIKTITDNPANRHYVRRNIMTKGTIIDTELGKARITSRPGQDGTVNAVLIV